MARPGLGCERAECADPLRAATLDPVGPAKCRGPDLALVGERPDLVDRPGRKRNAPESHAPLGTAGRNILIGPKTFNIDFSAIKNFHFSERMRLQYRAEFFNVLNHTNLNNPATAVTSGTFGRITSARDPRIIQMALKLYF